MSSFAAKNSRCFKCCAFNQKHLSLIQKLKEDGSNTLIKKVKLFYKKCDIEISNINSNYETGRYQFRYQKGQITIEHYYRVNVFVTSIDSQLFELNSKFA